MDVQKGKAATRAKNKYNAKNYDRVNLVLPKGQKADLQAHASNMGESLNGFVNRAITETLERDKDRCNDSSTDNQKTAHPQSE